MGRPKKDKPTHSSGMYVYKATVGHNFDGTPIRKAFYSSTSKESAKAKANQYIVEKKVAEQTGDIFISDKISFTQAAQKWLAAVKPNLSDSAYNNYEVAVRLHLTPFFGKAPLTDIKPIDIQNFFNKISKTTPLESIKKYKNCLNGIFKMAVDNDYCVKNPCAHIKVTSQCEVEAKQTYTAEQAELVLNFAKNHKDGLAIMLMLGYGIRKGETLALSKQDIDFDSIQLDLNVIAEGCQRPKSKVTVYTEDKENILFAKSILKTKARILNFVDITMSCSMLIEKRVRMANEQITFDKLPQAVGYLTEQTEQIRQIVAALQPQTSSDKHRLIEIDEACKITRKAKPTIYTFVRK